MYENLPRVVETELKVEYNWASLKNPIFFLEYSLVTNHSSTSIISRLTLENIQNNTNRQNKCIVTNEKYSEED